MVKMPPDVQETINKQKPIPVATADSDGKPNVVFITFLKVVDDETIYIADNFLNKTRANLDENPRVSIVTYDSENKKSFQVKGRVEIMTDGPVYEEVVAWVHAKSKAMPVKSAVVIRVEEVYNAMHGPDAGKRIV
ncbi:MAG: pyridoxamine 5'-phosphate oxidase family protein [Methanosarcinales archaeon]|nr:pyridoxamine 5'-phosphate oxidase family protein [Methanosarcinales archaeon]